MIRPKPETSSTTANWIMDYLSTKKCGHGVSVSWFVIFAPIHENMLHTGDQKSQAALEWLLGMGFDRFEPNESPDPTIVTKLIAKQGELEIFVDLAKPLVRVSVGEHRCTQKFVDPNAIIVAIAMCAKNAIEMSNLIPENMERYCLGQGFDHRSVVQTKHFVLN